MGVIAVMFHLMCSMCIIMILKGQMDCKMEMTFKAKWATENRVERFGVVQSNYYHDEGLKWSFNSERQFLNGL